MVIRRNTILAVKRQILPVIRFMRELHLLQNYEGVSVSTRKINTNFWTPNIRHSYAIAKAFNRRILIYTNIIRVSVVDKSTLMRKPTPRHTFQTLCLSDIAITHLIRSNRFLPTRIRFCFNFYSGTLTLGHRLTFTLTSHKVGQCKNI